MTPAAQFAEAYFSRGATPERLAFEIARMAYPALEVPQQLAQLDELATFVQSGRPAGTAEPQDRLPAADFLRVLAEDLNFHGSREDYYDPRNSLLPDVLERRKGLPIMLCLVCMAVGRRIGLEIDGLGFPSHFLAVYRDGAGDTILDPFLGLTLAPNEVERHLARLLGQPVNLTPEVWRPLTAQEMALRILHNLRNAYLTAKDLPMVEHVLDYLIAANPTEPQYWRERGLLHYRQRRWVQAHYDLRRYLQRVGLFSSVPSSSSPSSGLTSSPPSGSSGPESATPEPGARPANQGDRRVLEIYREVSNMVVRVN